MATNMSQGAADTQEIRKLITGYQTARALLAADEMDLVAHLDDGAKTSDELAALTGMHARSLYRFLRALAAVGLVVEDARGRFSAGPLAAGLRNAARIGVEAYRSWAELPFTLRTGRPAFPEVYGKGYYDYLAEDDAKAERFDSALAAVSRDWAPAVFEAYDFWGFHTVADIGGGRGTFLSLLLAAHPGIRGILFDMPQVIEHAPPILGAAGVSDRCQSVGGSFFEAVPAGADAYTLCNLLTDWDDEPASRILGACRSAMPQHGKVLIIDRILPPPGDPNRGAMAFLDLFFLVLEGGTIRTGAEFGEIAHAAGLEVARIIPTASTFSIVEAVPAG